MAPLYFLFLVLITFLIKSEWVLYPSSILPSFLLQPLGQASPDLVDPPRSTGDTEPQASHDNWDVMDIDEPWPFHFAPELVRDRILPPRLRLNHDVFPRKRTQHLKLAFEGDINQIDRLLQDLVTDEAKFLRGPSISCLLASLHSFHVSLS